MEVLQERKPEKTQRYFCTICCIQFPTLNERNVHLKSDFHVFNAKRQAVMLDPISYERYKEIQQAEETASQGVEVKVYICSLCKKRYNTSQQMDEHIKTKKHKANMRKFPEKAKNCVTSEVVEDNSENSSDTEQSEMKQKQPIAKKSETTVEDHQTDDLVEVAIDQLIEERKAQAPSYTPNHCLFCQVESGDLETNLSHMEKEHGFFIPNVECCCDIAGLMMYLHDKICIGHMCIWCEHAKPAFKHYKDVRQHMIDTCHCKMLYENDNLEEYDDYYDYSSNVHAVEIVSMDDISMTLSNGMTIGHRSMATYYKQRIKPISQRQLTVVDNKHSMPVPEATMNRYVGSKALITSDDTEYITSVKEALRRQIVGNTAIRNNQTTFRRWAQEGLRNNRFFRPRTFRDITAPNQW